MIPIPYAAYTFLLCPGGMAVKTLLEHSRTPRRIFSPSPRQMSGDGQGERGPPLRPWDNPWLLMRLFDHARSHSYCSAWTRFTPQPKSPPKRVLPPQKGAMIGAAIGRDLDARHAVPPSGCRTPWLPLTASL